MHLNIFRKILNLGINQFDPSYVKRLKWALNILALNSIFCVLIALFINIFFDKETPSPILYGSIIVFIGVLILNRSNRTFLAITVLFLSSNLLLVYYSIITGEETFTYGLFILFIIGLGLLYRDEYSRAYFLFNLFLTAICISFVMCAYAFHWFDHLVNPLKDVVFARQVNFFFLLFCTIIFSIVVIISYNNHYREMTKSLDEQKLLLAEVNHRVKNNLSIIIGLLNMKLNASRTKEAQSALTDLHGRIMAMALVHQQMYRKDASCCIEMDKYINELAEGIQNSLAGDLQVKICVDVDKIDLIDSVAISLGLTLNELITNSIKYAFEDSNDNIINVELKEKSKGILELNYRDNGVGMDMVYDESKEGMGLKLIRTLSEQLEGVPRVFNENGFAFRMEFKA